MNPQAGCVISAVPPCGGCVGVVCFVLSFLKKNMKRNKKKKKKKEEKKRIIKLDVFFIFFIFVKNFLNVFFHKNNLPQKCTIGWYISLRQQKKG